MYTDCEKGVNSTHIQIPRLVYIVVGCKTRDGCLLALLSIYNVCSLINWWIDGIDFVGPWKSYGNPYNSNQNTWFVYASVFCMIIIHLYILYSTSQRWCWHTQWMMCSWSIVYGVVFCSNAVTWITDNRIDRSNSIIRVKEHEQEVRITTQRTQ